MEQRFDIYIEYKSELETFNRLPYAMNVPADLLDRYADYAELVPIGNDITQYEIMSCPTRMHIDDAIKEGLLSKLRGPGFTD